MNRCQPVCIVHIITASIGGPSGWPDDPWAIVISRIVKAGTSCTVSAGNSGDEGKTHEMILVEKPSSV